MKKLITALLISSFVNSASADSYSEDLKRGFRQQQAQQQAILRQAEQQLHKETNRQAASTDQQAQSKLLDRNKNLGEPVLPRIPANNNSTYTEDLNYEH